MDDARGLAAARQRRAWAASWVRRWELRYLATRAAQRLDTTAQATANSFRQLAAAYGETGFFGLGALSRCKTAAQQIADAGEQS